MKQRIILIILGFFLSSGTASADKTDKLVELLVKKKIVTSEEAEAFIKELDAEDELKSSLKSVEKPVIIYNKGVVIKTTDNNYSIKLNARFHGIFSYENPDNDSSRSTFRMRRARILASGNIYAP